MSRSKKNAVHFLLLDIFFILITNSIYANDTEEEIKYAYSAIVFIENKETREIQEIVLPAELKIRESCGESN